MKTIESEKRNDSNLFIFENSKQRFVWLRITSGIKMLDLRDPQMNECKIKVSCSRALPIYCK